MKLIHIASRVGNKEAVALLIKFGASVEMVANVSFVSFDTCQDSR